MTPWPVAFELNGYLVEIQADPSMRLLDLLRDVLGETGTKEACGEGECGACTILVDGRAVNSCLYLVGEIDGRVVTTIEGITGEGGALSAVQQAFHEGGGTQCGFCTPGMVMAAVALLADNPRPSDTQIRDALTGNLCRCTGYIQIVDSIRAAARAGVR